MTGLNGDGPALVWLVLFGVTQALYALTFLIDLYHFTNPVNRVEVATAEPMADADLPLIILFYPVLRELEATMHTTFLALSRLTYPRDRFRVIAVANDSDVDTIASLRRLQAEFDFLDLIEAPATSDARWTPVWRSWDENPKAYWWHKGEFAGRRDLPPKKTRQLIYAFHQALDRFGGAGDFLVNYIDADSCPPSDHFMAGAVGMRSFDVLQSQNVAGNLNDSLAASFHAFDHMAWDGMKYPHLSANGRQPYWVLGKGLFFRASDLSALGGLHPWIAIEDPEVGMRFWANGKRLGIIENPLIEEVPTTFARGILQRKRWVCGFFQSLGEPLDALGFSFADKLKAWMNFMPCLSLWVNALGLPMGAWALWTWLRQSDVMPMWLVWLSAINIVAFIVSLTLLYINTWKRTGLVLTKTGDRVGYMLRINPLFIMAWWVIWLVPLWQGFWMYKRGGGLVWERTLKVNANESLIQSRA